MKTMAASLLFLVSIYGNAQAFCRGTIVSKYGVWETGKSVKIKALGYALSPCDKEMRYIVPEYFGGKGEAYIPAHYVHIDGNCKPPKRGGDLCD